MFLLSVVLMGITAVAPTYVSLRDWGEFSISLGSISCVYRCGGCGRYDEVLNLWLWAIVSVVPTALFWTLSLPTPPAGACASCGYNLTGNISGRCPECGTPVTNM